MLTGLHAVTYSGAAAEAITGKRTGMVRSACRAVQARHTHFRSSNRRTEESIAPGTSARLTRMTGTDAISL